MPYTGSRLAVSFHGAVRYCLISELALLLDEDEVSSFTNGKYSRTERKSAKICKSWYTLPKYSSLTAALLQTGLPSSSTAVHNFTWHFKEMTLACNNAVVSAVSSLCF